MAANLNKTRQIGSRVQPLDIVSPFLVDLYGIGFVRRLELGVRNKIILACAVRGLLRSRVAMSSYRRYLTIFFLAAAAAIPVLFPKTVAAREPVPALYQDIGGVLFSDPGEDPHLKADPGIRPFMETEALGASRSGVVESGVESGVCAWSRWERRGCGFGSRVNLMWRLFLRAWFGGPNR